MRAHVARIFDEMQVISDLSPVRVLPAFPQCVGSSVGHHAFTNYGHERTQNQELLVFYVLIEPTTVPQGRYPHGAYSPWRGDLPVVTQKKWQNSRASIARHHWRGAVHLTTFASIKIKFVS